MIVCIDYLSRHSDTAALSSATAAKVTNFILSRRILQHGPPRVLISDRGRQFTADVVKELLHLSDSQFCHSVPYHKQTNGLTERTIRTLTNMNAMPVASDHNWDDILPFITHAYHTAKHETMGYSPFYPVDARVPPTTSTPSSPSFKTRPAYQTPSALLMKLRNSLVSTYCRHKTARNSATTADIRKFVLVGRPGFALDTSATAWTVQETAVTLRQPICGP